MARGWRVEPALAALAVGAQAINALATSFPLERNVALDWAQLHALHLARPWLDGLSLGALALLALGEDRRAFELSLGAGLGLQAASRLISAQGAHPAYEGALAILEAAALDARLAPEEHVVGVFHRGAARCYPLRLLQVPAVLHDQLGGEGVAVSYCPMSRAAVAFYDDWEGRRLRLQAVGAPGNDLALFDQRTGGVISQLRARVMTGPNKGTPIPTLPATLTRWRDWRSLHPETSGAWFEPGWRGAYLDWLLGLAEASDARSPRPIYALAGRPDARLPAKTPVVGLYRLGHALAVPREALAEAGVLEAMLGSEPVVVIWDPAREMAGCFSRRLDQHVLALSPAEAGSAIDAQGVHWDVAGRGTDGRQLTPIEGAVDGVYWFAWAQAHPRTGLLEAGPQVTLTRERRRVVG